jgi:predicted SAM-dependent methyltransferase
MPGPAFDPSAHPRRVNLGCGFDKRDGYLNVDLHSMHSPDLVSEVTDLRSLPSNYYEHAVAQDVLEHITRLRTRTALREWNRILQTGGTLELRVPNVVGLVQLLMQKQNRSPARQEQLLQCLFGTQRYDGDFHQSGFTDIYLKALLEEAGFKVVKLASMDEWLFHVLARKVAHAPPSALLRIEKDADFLRAVYQEMLGRDPDPQAEDFFGQRLSAGMVREIVVNIIQESEEYKNHHRAA